MKANMIKGLVKEVRTMGREEMMNMTVAELKEVAKELGMKGYSKLRKAELASAIEAFKAMEQIKLTIEEAKAEGKDVDDSILKFRSACTEQEIVLPKGLSKKALARTAEVYEDLMKNGERTLAMSFSAIVNHIAEEVDNIYSPATRLLMDSAAKISQHAEFLVELDLDSNKKMINATNSIEHKPASDLSRACPLEYKRISDGINSYVINTLENVIGLSLAKSLTRVNVKGKKNKTKEKVGYLKKALGRLLDGAEHEFDINGRDIDCEAIALIFKNNGLVRPALPSDVKSMKDGEYIRVYKFLGVTPSGLRSASLMAACTQKIEMVNGQINVIDCDDRKELLNKAGSGAFKFNFLDSNNEFKKAESLKELFKGMTRIMQCAPGSEVIDQLHTYVVVHNLAKGATFNYQGTENTAEMTKDGNTKGAVESLIEYAESNELDVNTRVKRIAEIKALVGTCDQTRAASSLKASTTWCTREDLLVLLKEVALRRIDNISFIVVGGERFDSVYDKHGNLVKSAYELVCEAGKQEELFKNLQFIGDDNAFKLPKFDSIVNLVRLKKAHLSDSATNMVVLMSMLFADSKATMNYLQNKGTSEIVKNFESIGIKVDMEDGSPVYNKFDETLIRGLNNDSQDLNYLFKTAPLAVLRSNPGIVRSLMVNLIKSCQRKVNELKFDFNSKYTVVQADDAVLFTSGLAGESHKSLQILNEGEVYCSEFKGFKKVSAVRHPISSIFAISTFKVVTLAEIMKRINKLKASEEVKQYLMNFYSNAKGYAILPADEFLMEKHDGMDWDIDAMQFILEEEAVEILAKLPNIGSQIEDKDNWQRETQLPEERAIVEDHNYTRPSSLTAAPTKDKKDNKVLSKGAAAFTKHINSNKRDYSFNSCLRLVMEFFASPIANVGEIANAFYNNMLLYSVMASPNKDAFTIKTQEAIARSFRNEFKCTKKKKYTPNVSLELATLVSKNGGRFTYKSNKQICCSIIHEFSECCGTIEEVRDFLLDCGFHNRYLAETSIDAAKNNYIISNMFDFSSIARALGSNKNMVVKLFTYDSLLNEDVEECREIGSFVADNKDLDNKFYELAEEMGLTAIMDGKNNFNLPLLFPITSYYNDLEECMVDVLVSDHITELEKAAKNNDDISLKDVKIGVVDEFAKLKLNLVDIINKLIVITCKAFYCEMEKQEAVDMRNVITTSNALATAGDESVSKIEFAINDVVNSARSCYATMTTNLKETEDFDGQASATYKKEGLLKALRATIKLSLKEFNAVQIGFVVAKMLANLKYGESCNPILLKLFNEELCAFYNSLSSRELFNDFANLGIAVSRISLFIDNEDKLLSKAQKETLVGEEVTIVNGVGCINDTIFIETEDKKVNCTGFINCIEGHYVVQSNREFIQEDAAMGFFFNVRWAAKDTLGEMDFSTATSIEIRKTLQDAQGKRHYNAFVATDERGRAHHICDIQMNDDMRETINQMIAAEVITPGQFSFLTAENSYIKGGELQTSIRHTLYIDGRIALEIAEALTEEEIEGMDELSIPVDPEADMNVEGQEDSDMEGMDEPSIPEDIENLINSTFDDADLDMGAFSIPE